MKHILFVCTGNTCRSPMAQALFNDYASSCGVDTYATSAGLSTDGSMYAENAVKALQSIGIPLTGSSEQVTPALLQDSDIIIGISKNHARMLQTAFPQFADKIYTFPHDISDPFGGDIAVYISCMNEIKACIPQICDGVKQ